MGRTVGHGMGWMVLGTVLAKGAAFVSQIVLGIILLPEQFGVYFTALSIAGFVQVVRDGGVREVLVQRGASEYDELAGPVFWLAAAMNTGAGLLLAGLAPLLSRVYDQPLTPLLLVIALSLPLSTPAAVQQCRLRIDLRFGVLSRIQMVSALTRHASTIAFALAGLGSRSFVLPLLLVAVVEGVWSFWATRQHRAPWLRAPRISIWGRLLRTGGWMVFQTLANILLDVGAFAVLGLLISDTAIVGVYGFAYNWIAQIGVLLSYNMQQVLFPALTRIAAEPARFRDAAVRALRALMLVGAISCLGLAAVMDPLENLLWHDKWDQAVLPVMILGVFFAFRVSFGLCAAVLMARARFRALSFVTLFEGLGVVGGAALGAWIHGSAAGIALWTGAALAIGRLAGTGIVLGRIGVSFPGVLAAFLPAWLLATLAAAGAVGAERLLGLGALLESAWPAESARELLGSRFGGYAHLAFVQGPRLAFLGGVCSLAFFAAARLVIPRQLSDTISALPGRLGRPLGRMLRIGA